MAKILFAVPIGQDMGGIITSTEQYVAGLKDAGHDVSFVCVVFTKADPHFGSAPRGKFGDDYRTGPGTGVLYHTTSGWRSEPRCTIATRDGVKRFLTLANAHDIVIWASMYGFRNETTEGTTIWVDAIRKCKAAQLFMIHDDHIKDRYPWALALAKYARAYVGVQPCSYDSLEGVSAPRAMVYTPLPPMPKRVTAYEHRAAKFMSIQIWKGWKNADKLVAAAAHMTDNTVAFGGDGIQLRYMRSPDKCPPRFRGLWAAAMKKQEYLGVLDETSRDEFLSTGKFLVDLSLRHNSGQYNRIVQEAMAQGCVVIANPEFISGGAEDPLFQPWVHYIPISSTLYDDPKALAYELQRIDASTAPAKYTTLQNGARRLMATFERKALAEQLVRLVDNASLYTHDPELLKRANAEFLKVFGGKA